MSFAFLRIVTTPSARQNFCCIITVTRCSPCPLRVISTHRPTPSSFASSTAGAHLQVPAVTALSSHSAARTWIRSVSYPEQSGNTVVHFDNESEPLIKVQAAVMMCAEWLSVWFCTFKFYSKYCCLLRCLLCL